MKNETNDSKVNVSLKANNVKIEDIIHFEIPVDWFENF